MTPKSQSELYLKNLENLNLYSPDNVYSLDNSKLNNTLSTIGSIITNNSIDFSNTLLSRVINPNTPIQKIANEEYLKALARTSAKNLRTNLLPSISVSSILDVSINKPLDYWSISGETKSFSDILKGMIGFESSENPVPFITKTFTSEDSANWLKTHRGQGQIDSYNSNISKNTYKDTNKYNTDDNVLSINKGESTDSLLYKTNILINNTSVIDGIPSDIGKVGDSINTTAVVFKYKNNSGKLITIPKGDGTTTDDSGTKFLRVFSKNKPYGSTKDLLKYNHGTAGINSVLQTVFPSIAPTREEETVKNLMFSMENLSFVGSTIELKKSEKGINGGRAMWFAPYDIQISENATASWEKVNFIGRSEPIYTHSGSERTCSLSFVLIVDYPSELNKNVWRTNSNNEFDKFFRQDNNLKKSQTTLDENKSEVAQVENTPVVKTIPVSQPNNPFDVSIKTLKYYFDNNDYSLKETLTQDNSSGIGQTAIDDFNLNIERMISFLNTEDGQRFKIVIDANSSSLFTADYNKILSFLRGRAIYNKISSGLSNEKMKLNSYTSSLQQLISPKLDQYSNERFVINFNGENNAVNPNASASTVDSDVVDRKCSVYLVFNGKLTPAPVEDILAPNADAIIAGLSPVNVKPVYSDFYFERYKPDENIVLAESNDGLSENILKTYGNNIKYFSPVFHSQTPEDFNARLEFLQQCTKQGTVVKGSSVSNSIFGRPPVIILRLGDFFNTKMIVNNVGLSYEPLIWDTNPEGIGMQPMICRVTMDCVLVGGSSLRGPLNQLQNALSNNFYANTEVYNENASKASVKGKGNTNNI